LDCRWYPSDCRPVGFGQKRRMRRKRKKGQSITRGYVEIMERMNSTAQERMRRMRTGSSRLSSVIPSCSLTDLPESKPFEVKAPVRKLTSTL
jgi:hypothetical protein